MVLEPLSLGRARVPCGLSWELVRGEDLALYLRGPQEAWERGSCWAFCSGSPRGACPLPPPLALGRLPLGRKGDPRYCARRGLRVTLDLSASLARWETETM